MHMTEGYNCGTRVYYYVYVDPQLHTSRYRPDRTVILFAVVVVASGPTFVPYNSVGNPSSFHMLNAESK